MGPAWPIPGQNNLPRLPSALSSGNVVGMTCSYSFCAVLCAASPALSQVLYGICFKAVVLHTHAATHSPSLTAGTILCIYFHSAMLGHISSINIC